MCQPPENAEHAPQFDDWDFLTDDDNALPDESDFWCESEPWLDEE